MYFARFGLVLLGLTAGTAPLLAQQEVFGTTNCAVGVTKEALTHTLGKQMRGGFISTMPAQWGTREVLVDMTVELKYSLSKLVGEPVWGFVPRYTFGSGILIEGAHNIVREESWGDDRIEVELEGVGTQLTVSANLFDLIRVRNFYFNLETTWRHWEGKMGRTKRAHFNMHLTGITGNAGEWGWDVPGSPSWNRAMLWQSEDLTPDHQHAPEDYLEAKEAKAAWNRLIRLAEKGNEEVLTNLRVYRIDLDLSRFTTAVEQLQPGATRHLFAKPERRLYESTLDWQLRSLIQGVQRDAAERRDPNGAVLTDNQMRRRMQIVDEAVRGLAGPEQRAMVRAWQDLQREIAESQLEADVLLVGRAISEQVQNGAEEASTALSAAVQRVAEQMKSRGGSVSPELGQRWEEIQRVSELLGGLKRSVYVFAVAQTSFSNFSSGSAFHLTVTENGLSVEEKRRRKRLAKQRERERAIARKKAAKDFARRRKIDDRYRPDPTRSNVHRVLVPTEWTTQEVESSLRTWAESGLGASQKLSHKVTTYQVYTNYKIYTFSDSDAAESAAKKMKAREFSVPPPSSARTDGDKPAAPK